MNADLKETPSTNTPLSRTTYETGPVAPVRIVHIGLGAFHRAHQAWYTAQVDQHAEWGIAAFTGRSPEAAEQLMAQDDLYTLVTRDAERDEFEVVTSVVEAHDGARLDVLSELVSRRSTAVITLTVTESGYRVSSGLSGPELDTDDDLVATDIAALRANCRGGAFTVGPDGLEGRDVQSAAARIVVGLSARRAAGSGPLAIVSCDNLPGNGAAARTAVVETAQQVDRGLAEWIASEVSFVDTSIDRITPKTTQQDREAVTEATGFTDLSPVVTEPFSSWVISGDFPAGRPPWEDAGARIVEDLEPFERRKLWMLNGAHSLMAYAGQLRGHATVAQAMADPTVATWVEELWDTAANHLQHPELDIDAYRDALRLRFQNPRIAHHLAQIGVDGSLKLAVRAVPILQSEQEVGRSGTAALRMVAAWMDHICLRVEAGQEVQDPAADDLVSAVTHTEAQTSTLLRVLDSALAEDSEIVAAVRSLRGTFTG